MSASAEASRLIRRCAEPVSAGESVKALIRRASARAGLPFPRGRALWYGEARSVRAEEMDLLRKRAGAEPARERSKDGLLDAARLDAIEDFAELLARLERIETFMARLDSRMARGTGDR